MNIRRQGAAIVPATIAILIAIGAVVQVSNAAGKGAESLKPTAVVTQVQTQLNRIVASSGTTYPVARYLLPSRGSVPHILAIDKNDYVWFSESGGRFAKNFIDRPAANRIGRIDQNGKIVEWTIAKRETSPMGIIFDSAGALWITERLADRIARLDTDGTITRFPIPTKDSWPTGIAVGPDGRIWFSETNANQIGVLDPKSGTVREFAIPTPNSKATGIAVDRQGDVWVAQRDANIIGRLNPRSGEFKQFQLPTPDSKPCGITIAPDGTVWFSERGGGKLGTIAADGTIREYALQDRSAGPFLMAIDKRGDIWFTQIFANRIGRLDIQTKRFEHFDVAEGTLYPAGIAIDSKGNVWFAEQASDHIGVIVRSDLAYLADEPLGPSRPTVRASADTYNIQSYPLPRADSIPGIIEIDPAGTVWFTEMGGGFVGPGFPPGPPGSYVGRIRNGQLEEIATPTPESGPTSLGLDPINGDVWVSLRAANKIARIRDDKIQEFDIPVADSVPIGVTVDRKHHVWVALSAASAIGRRSPDGEWAVLKLPDPAANPRTIFVDRLGRIWFSEKDGNHIGLINEADWSFQRWQIPTRMAWPLSLVDDVHGNVWFSQMRSDKIARFDPQTAEFTEYDLPIQSAPFKLSYDEKNNAMWISTIFANAVLRFDISIGDVTSAYPIPNEGVWVGGIARDDQDCFWVTEQFGNQIDRLCIDGISMVFAQAGAGPQQTGRD